MLGPLHNTHVINPYTLLHTCFHNILLAQLISCLLFYDVLSDMYRLVSYNKANTSDMPQLFLQYYCCWLWVLTSVTGQCPLCFFFVFPPTLFMSKNTRNCYFKKTNIIAPFCKSWHLVQCIQACSMYILWLWIVASTR